MNIKAARGIAALTSSIVRSSSARCGHVVATRCLAASQPLAYSRRSACNMSSESESECTHHQDRGASLRGHLQRLRSSPSETLLLDGGTGEELFLRGVPDDRKIWSATAIVHEEYHSVVEDVHKSFIEAGSQAVTTNSYGITPGVDFTDGEEVQRLVGKAGEIARRAVGNSGALVLGSLGPQVESYRPDLIMEHDDGVRAYLNAIAGLHPHVDAYLAETMSCVEEACQAADAVSRLDARKKRPMLVSFTLNGSGNVRSGESVVDAIPKLVEYAKERGVERESFALGTAGLSESSLTIQVVGVMFNCCEPESISKALDEIRSSSEVRRYLHHPPGASSASRSSDDGTPKILLGAYSNRLTPVPDEWTMESSEAAQPMREDLSPEQYWEFVRLWQGRNETGCLQLIGGCCGIGPGHIAALKRHFADQ